MSIYFIEGIGFLGGLIGIGAFYQRTNLMLNLFIGLSLIVWGFHYFLLGEMAGVAISVISVFRILSGIYIDKIFKYRHILFWVFNIVVLATTPFIYYKLYDLITIFLGLLMNYIYFYTGGRKFRELQSVGLMSMVIYNTFVGSISGFVIMGVQLLMNIYSTNKNYKNSETQVDQKSNKD